MLQKSNYSVPYIDPNNKTIKHITKCDYFSQPSQPGPIFKMNKQWNKSVIRLVRGGQNKITKMIIWNNKLHIIIVNPQDRYFKVTMLDPEDIGHIYTNGYYSSQRPYYFVHDISWSIHRPKSELYIIIITRADWSDQSIETAGWETYFLIFDLNAKKVKRQYLLNFKNINGEIFNHSIQNISIINNHSFKPKNTISCEVINHWLRTDTNIPSLIPKDISIIINQFYSLYTKKNTLQIVIFGLKSCELINEGDVELFSSWYLHRAIIDVDAVKNKHTFDSKINLKIVNTKQIQTPHLVANEELGTHYGVYQVLSIRVHDELYMILSNATWKIDLGTGLTKKMQHILPYEEDDYIDCKHLIDRYFMTFDSISCIDSMNEHEMDQNDRYLFFLMEDRKGGGWHSKNFDLWCFDRINKELFQVDHTRNRTELCFKELALYDSKYVDMVFYGDELIVSKITSDELWIYRTTLTSLKTSSQ